ncbi:WASH complex subunit 3 [Musca vetustissima]|uniref:WASH complex subunit 3 n=1 Tax=Musca vetustissima TaxID=27455 RepID=UPI002AB79209|nr:WASH complex subunit 3 [Musca vetustissima]
MDASELLTQNVDKTQLPPLHQKRILAFVNHFLISSCSFLNEFSLQCETKFIELERKLQKVEAALTILEAKLASIPDVENKETATPNSEKTAAVEQNNNNNNNNDVSNKTEPGNNKAPAEQEEDVAEQPAATPTPQGIPASEHSLYKKFFKMLQVGVPLPAVQLKMQSEGLDANILSNPQTLLPAESTDES